MNTTSAIKASGLTRKFGKNTAVDNINLTIEHGEIYGFLGPNGAGKSTTIKMLVTLLAPTTGDAWIIGRSIKNDPTEVRLNIGVALQEAALDEQQTGIELLKLQGKLYGLSSGEIDTRLKHLRELIDIGDALDKRIKTYSGGMKRRLDLAAALMHNPSVLFLDEPTTGLDPLSRIHVWEEIKRLNQTLGMTIFLTTQHMEEADRLANRLGIISEGRIVTEGTPQELKRRIGADLVIVEVSSSSHANEILNELRNLPGVDDVDTHSKEIYISSSDGSKIIGPIARVFEQKNIEVEQLSLRTPSLDDVFLEATGNRLARDQSKNEESTIKKQNN